MSRAAFSLRSVGRPGLGEVVPPLAAAAFAVVLGVLLALFGAVAALAPLALLAVVILSARPRLLLALYVSALVLLENDELGFLPQRAAAYRGVPSLADLALAVLAGATVLWLARKGRSAWTPEPFTLPLALLALVLFGGAMHGYFAGGDTVEILNSLRSFVPLLVLPFLVVNLLDDERRLVQAAGVAAALAAVKGVEGLVAWAGGLGRPLHGTTITFYQPAANYLLLLLVAGAVAAFLLRVPLPLPVRLALPLCALAYVLSYRRNFWIAGLLALILLLLATRLQHGRRALLPAAAVVALALATTVFWHGPPELEGPVAQRIMSLTPERIVANPYDRYRLDEQRNVLAEIRESPMLGIGLGVPWRLTHPLPVELPGGRLYTHTVVLWFWLKLGLAGLAIYLWLVAAAVVTALGVARRSASGIVRASALALAAVAVAMAVAETTGSFFGVSDRYTVLVAVGLGWIAAARRCAVREGAR